MAFWFIHAVDKAGQGQLRLDNRPVHLEYLERHADRIVAGGAKLTDDGESATGSVLLVEFDDRAGVEAFAAGDPFAKAGLFERVEITRWRKVFPKG